MTPDQNYILTVLARRPSGATLSELLSSVESPERSARLTVGIMVKCGQIKPTGNITSTGSKLWECAR